MEGKKLKKYRSRKRRREGTARINWNKSEEVEKQQLQKF